MPPGGGQNWSGPVACPTGAYCKNDGKYVLHWNHEVPRLPRLPRRPRRPLTAWPQPPSIWYSQCVAIGSGDSPIGSGGSSGGSSNNNNGGSVVTKTLTTIFSVGGASPTVVSTVITYITPRVTGTSKPTTMTLTPDPPYTDDGR
jgi:hypothetical protein